MTDKVTDEFYYINTPVSNMRKEPFFNSEIVSQGFFSEKIRVIDRSGCFALIETLVDHYAGWVRLEEIYLSKSAFSERRDEEMAIVNRLSAHLYHVNDTIYGPILTLPFESRLCVLNPFEIPTSRWLKVRLHNEIEAYIQRGDVEIASFNPLSRERMILFSQRFLNLPYTWGGRSSFGFDCSGFVQMLYRQMGVYLPRDSKDQCNFDAFDEVTIDQMEPGDLIFFGQSREKIFHVGMAIGGKEFIHATVSENQPYIRISPLDQWTKGYDKYPFCTARALSRR